MINWIRSLLGFTKQEEEIEMPDHIEIVYTKEAVMNGTFDDFNKEILLKINGRTKKFEYTPYELSAMIKSHNLPVIDLTKMEDPYEFEEVTTLQGYFTEKA